MWWRFNIWVSFADIAKADIVTSVKRRYGKVNTAGVVSCWLLNAERPAAYCSVLSV